MEYLKFFITYASGIFALIYYILTVVSILFYGGTNKYPLFVVAMLLHILHYLEHRRD